MPIPAGPLIAAGASLLGQGASAASQAGANKKSRRFAEKMYGIQRTDALADWNSMNEYNHPSAQMARLREAGLNPNLVYGKGADNTAAAVRSSSAPSWDSKPNTFDGGAVLSNYQNFQTNKATVDNLRAQNTVIAQEAALKAAQTANTLQQTDSGKFDLGQRQTLAENSLQMAAENLRKLKTSTDIQLQENERAAATNSASLKTAAENILNMRAQRANTEEERKRIQQTVESLRKDNRLKDLDIQLRELGISPGDNIFLRILGRLLGRDNPLSNSLEKNLPD